MEIKPRIHLFGHIHSQHGVLTAHGTTYSNGAIMNADYSVLSEVNILEV